MTVAHHVRRRDATPRRNPAGRYRRPGDSSEPYVPAPRRKPTQRRPQNVLTGSRNERSPPSNSGGKDGTRRTGGPQRLSLGFFPTVQKLNTHFVEIYSNQNIPLPYVKKKVITISYFFLIFTPYSYTHYLF